MTPDMIELIAAVQVTAITLIVGWIGQQSSKRRGVEFTAQARQTLHSALETGAMLAWSQLSDQVEAPTKEDLIKIVLDHVKGEGAGDSVVHLAATETGLRNLAEAKLTDIGNRLDFTRNTISGLASVIAK